MLQSKRKIWQHVEILVNTQNNSVCVKKSLGKEIVSSEFGFAFSRDCYNVFSLVLTTTRLY